MASPLRILFAGSGEFGLPALAALIGAAGHEVVRVYSQPDRPAGRGRKLTPTPIAQFALDRSLPLVRTENINREPDLPAADVTVVIAFGQKIAETVVNHARLGSVNLHASLLPKYRGAAPIHWAVISGETTVGNSVIRLAPKMDAGAILGQSSLHVGDLETTGELHDRLAADGAPLMLKVLDELATGHAVEAPQDESRATLAPKLGREQAVIDWSAPAQRIACKIRGLFPWPGCRVELRDAAGTACARLTLVRARPAGGEGSRWVPGEVMADGRVSTGAGDEGVEIVEVQPEGKRPMPLSDYRRGNPWHPGMRLVSVT